MSVYPNAIFAKRSRENRPGADYDPTQKKRLFVEDIDYGDDEISAIQTELGTNPKGSASSVKERIAALECGKKDLATDILSLSLPDPVGGISEEHIKQWDIDSPTVVLTINFNNGFTGGVVEIFTGGVNFGNNLTSSVDRFFVNVIGTSLVFSRIGSAEFFGAAVSVVPSISGSSILFTVSKAPGASIYYANVITKVRLMSVGASTANSIVY